MKGFTLRALASALVILLISVSVANAREGSMEAALRRIDHYTAGVGLLAVLGVVLGYMYSVAGAGVASIVAPDLARHAERAARRGVREALLGLYVTLIGVVIAVAIAVIIAYVHG